jgi:hypothetical protein
MLDFLSRNKEWIFSGVGIALVTLVIAFGSSIVARARRHLPTVRVSAACVSWGPGQLVDTLVITVQNPPGHHVLYIGNIFLELSTREQFITMRDPFTGHAQGARRELQPGDSLTYHIPLSDIVESGLPPRAFKCAAARDSLDHVYRSSESELQRSLRPFIRNDRRAAG